MRRRRIHRLLLLFLLLPIVAAAQPDSGPRSNEDVLRPDTLHLPVPGRLGVETPADDTTRRDRRLLLEPITRFRHDARLDTADWRAYLDSLANTPEARRRRNLTITSDQWMPSKADKERRAAEIRTSQGQDEIFTNHYVPLVSAPIASIARFLGIIEDVTPKIAYTLTRTEPVTVKIYSIEADLVATLVDGPQSPGVYSFDWDLHDDARNRVPFGDYIAEVIASKRLVLRKRIEVP